MSENKCQMCWKENPNREVKDGEHTLQVCAACQDKYEQEKVYKRIQPLVEQLCKELNGGDHKRIARALLDAVNHEHRYLQSTFFQALWLFFGAYGKQDESRYFDGRNVHCKGMAKKWYESV